MKINKLLIATHNLGKFAELKDKLNVLDIEIVSLKELGIEEDYEEVGKTYEDIALAKAKFYYDITKIPTLADDSGFSVDALGGEPGVKSRRWPGYAASDEELLEMLFDKLRGVADQERTAKFVSVLALFDGHDQLITRGEMYGTVAHQLICGIKPGIPFSSVFYPEGYDRVSSQMSVEEKNSMSHRGKALDQIINKLK